jgi:hypothetical protein
MGQKVGQMPAPQNFRRSHRQAQKHFEKLARRFNYHHEANRIELYHAAKETEDPSDPIVALAFYNQFGQDFKLYPENPFNEVPASIRRIIMTMIYMMRHMIDFDSPKVMPIYHREMYKLQEILQFKAFYNGIHLEAMMKQKYLERKQRLNGNTTCNLYQPGKFEIPSLKRIIQVHLHRELAMTTITNLHRVKKDYSAQQYILHVLKQGNHLPERLVDELLNLHINCRHHSNTLTGESGTKLNLYHKVLKPDDELHKQLVIAECPTPLMERIYSIDEAKVIFFRILRKAELSNMEIDHLVKYGFRTIHNYDPDYPRYMVPPLM